MEMLKNIKISQHWFLIVGVVLIVAGLIALDRLIGVPSEPAACDAGPMEAAQCRSRGLERDTEGNWK